MNYSFKTGAVCSVQNDIWSSWYFSKTEFLYDEAYFLHCTGYKKEASSQMCIMSECYLRRVHFNRNVEWSVSSPESRGDPFIYNSLILTATRGSREITERPNNYNDLSVVKKLVDSSGFLPNVPGTKYNDFFGYWEKFLEACYSTTVAFT